MNVVDLTAPQWLRWLGWFLAASWAFFALCIVQRVLAKDPADRSCPIREMDGVAQIAAGGSHTLLLKQDGSVRVAGSNGAGQIGLGPATREALAFVPLALPRP